MPKLPDPTKPSTRRVDVKPTTAARVASEIDDPTKISTSAFSQTAKDQARRELEKEKEREKA